MGQLLVPQCGCSLPSGVPAVPLGPPPPAPSPPLPGPPPEPPPPLPAPPPPLPPPAPPPPLTAVKGAIPGGAAALGAGAVRPIGDEGAGPPRRRQLGRLAAGGSHEHGPDRRYDACGQRGRARPTALRQGVTKSAVPEWASFFSEEQYTRFIATVEAVMAARGLALELGEDGVYSGAAGGPKVHVRTLARECHSLPDEQWEARAGEMLDSMMRVVDEQTLLGEIASDWERARPLLRAKLWPESALGAVEGGELDVALRPLVPGLALGLALQLPGAVAAVKRQDAGGWGVSLDEAFEVAVANVRNAGRLAVEELPIDPERSGGGVVQAIFDGPYFLASHALFLDAYLDQSPRFGLLVVVPHAGAVAFYVIRDGTEMEAAVARLSSFAMRAYQKAPRPLSPIVYWRSPAAELEPLAVLQAEGLRFQPSERFLAEVATPLGLLSSAPEPTVATRSRQQCQWMREQASAGELLRVTPVEGEELPFDPELGLKTPEYWLYRDDRGRVIDMVQELVFDSLEEAVSALFVAPVEIDDAPEG